MRFRLRPALLSLTFLLLLWSAYKLGVFSSILERLAHLAQQPAVATAFSDPGDGRVDALVMLLSFVLLAPIAIFVVLAVLVFILIIFALLFEPVLRLMRLPEWMAVPVVLAGSAGCAWAYSGLWLPQSMHVFGLVARAWFVYFSSVPTSFPR
jgi:hypothetical protein